MNTICNFRIFLKFIQNGSFGLSILFFVGCASSETEESRLEKFNRARVEYSGTSFKQFLKDQKISLEDPIQNEYEDLQPGNLYSNHWLNFSIDLPDRWEIDRGVQPSSVIRAFQRDSALTMAVGVVKWADDYRAKGEVNINSIEYLNSTAQGDYKSFMAEFFKEYSGQVPINFEMREVRKPKHDFVLFTYLTRHIDGGEEFFMRTSIYQTSIFGMTYSISYSSLDFLHDDDFASKVLNSFRANLPPTAQ